LKAQTAKHAAALTYKLVLFACAASLRWVSDAAQPAVRLHAAQKGIEGPKADIVSVLAQFAQYPLPDDRAFARVTRDVHLPKEPEGFSEEGFVIICHYVHHVWQS
jgi:hypothetical protein